MKIFRNLILFIIFAGFASVLLVLRGHSAVAQSGGQQGASQPASGVTVQAIVPATTVAIGKPFELIVRVKTTSEGDTVAEPRLPGLEGFQVIGRDQRTSSQMSIINGDVQSQVIRDYVFTLAAESLGKKEIGAAEVTVGAKSLSTKPIHMNVVVAGKAPPSQNQNQVDQQNPFGDDDTLDPVDQMYQNLLKRRFDQMNGAGRGAGGNSGNFPSPNPGATRQIPGLNTDEAFFIREEQDKTSAYVGEQITASWYLYTRNAIRNIDTLKYPDLKGFWKEDIEIANRLNFQDEVVNGIPYKRALLVSYALFPIKEGPALIDSYKAKCDIAMGPFGMGQTMPFTKASADVKINISPLPTEGRPKDFTGAVGEFNVRTSIGSAKIETGQPFSFKIRIEGHGNAKPVDLPPLDLPSSVELYDTRNETKFFKNGESYKEFEVLLIPRVAGPLKLPSVSIGVFDPKTKQYTQKSAPGLSINVGVGKAGEKFMGQSNLQSPSANSSKGTREALSLPAPVSITSAVWLNPHPGKVFWSGLYALIFLILVGYGFRILGGGDRKRDLFLQLRKRLKAIQAALAKDDFRLVGTSGLNAINHIIGQHVEGEAGATHETVKLLRELPPSLRNALEKDLLRLIQYFESLSFAPETLLQDEKTQSRMKTETQDLERVLTRMIEQGQENTAGGQQAVQS